MDDPPSLDGAGGGAGAGGAGDAGGGDVAEWLMDTARQRPIIRKRPGLKSSFVRSGKGGGGVLFVDGDSFPFPVIKFKKSTDRVK